MENSITSQSNIEWELSKKVEKMNSESALIKLMKSTARKMLRCTLYKEQETEKGAGREKMHNIPHCKKWYGKFFYHGQWPSDFDWIQRNSLRTHAPCSRTLIQLHQLQNMYKVGIFNGTILMGKVVMVTLLATYAPSSTAFAHTFTPICFLFIANVNIWKSFLHLRYRIPCNTFFIFEFYFIFHFDARKRRSVSRFVFVFYLFVAQCEFKLFSTFDLCLVFRNTALSSQWQATEQKDK